MEILWMNQVLIDVWKRENPRHCQCLPGGPGGSHGRSVKDRWIRYGFTAAFFFSAAPTEKTTSC